MQKIGKTTLAVGYWRKPDCLTSAGRLTVLSRPGGIFENEILRARVVDDVTFTPIGCVNDESLSVVNIGTLGQYDACNGMQ